MPFKIIGNKKEGYKLVKLKDNKVINKVYKSKESAGNAGLNFMRYRNEEGYIKGNKILKKENKKK